VVLQEKYLNRHFVVVFMIIPEKQIKEFRQAIEAAKRPLIYFDDDPDGLCSFLLLYRFIGEGKGVMVKTTSRLSKKWANKVEEYNPDVLFVLDVPVVEQEFIDSVKVPIYWVDHHMPVDRIKIHYMNPRLHDKEAYVPTTRMAYELVQQDIWIGAVGCVADWHVPDFLDKLSKEHPGLIPDGVSEPEVAMYKTTAGKLARMFGFLLKGKSSDAMKCVKILSRIESPEELLEGTSSAGKYLLKRFEKINGQYAGLLERALKSKSGKKVLLFKYEADEWSYTSELSNELAQHNQDKVVLVCREKDGLFKCSLRSRGPRVLEPLQKALVGVEGRGGGHEQACGLVVASEDFDRFLEQLEKEL
jgi:oligoribonuclease NrnB/cAMP/cGMP phosphodiesterase (DHH superfamily)